MSVVAMKVANVVEESRIGGPQRRILLVTLGLSKQYDIHTTVVFPTWGGDVYESLLQSNDVDYMRLSLTKLSRDVSGAIKYLITFFSEVKELSHYFSASKFDLIHASGGSWQYKAVVAAKMAKIPGIWHLNDTSIDGTVKKIFNVVAKWGASAFIVAGSSVREYYLEGKSFELPNYLIPAPVDTDAYLPSCSKGRKVKRPHYKIICVGNVSQGKGYQYLFEALLFLDIKKIKIDLDICGGRFSTQVKHIEFLDNVASQFKNISVKFHGVQKNTLSFLQDADLFVCPSLSEASPMAVWEAMSAACPIVTTDVGDVSVHIEDRVSGLIVPPANSNALSIAIETMLNNPNQARAMGVQARRHAVLELGIDEVVRLHAQCYKSVLGVLD